jgi:hypothetical protein
MRVIFSKISEWWEVICSYIRSRNSQLPASPTITAAVAKQPWVMMGELTQDEAKIYADPMEGFDNIILEGDAFNTRTI